MMSPVSASGRSTRRARTDGVATCVSVSAAVCDIRSSVCIETCDDAGGGLLDDHLHDSVLLRVAHDHQVGHHR